MSIFLKSWYFYVYCIYYCYKRTTDGFLRCIVRAIAFLISNFNTRKHESTKTGTRNYEYESSKHNVEIAKIRKYDDEDAKTRWRKLDNYRFECISCFRVFVFEVQCFLLPTFVFSRIQITEKNATAQTERDRSLYTLSSLYIYIIVFRYFRDEERYLQGLESIVNDTRQYNNTEG